MVFVILSVSSRVNLNSIDYSSIIDFSLFLIEISVPQLSTIIFVLTSDLFISFLTTIAGVDAVYATIRSVGIITCDLLNSIVLQGIFLKLILLFSNYLASTRLR